MKNSSQKDNCVQLYIELREWRAWKELSVQQSLILKVLVCRAEFVLCIRKLVYSINCNESRMQELVQTYDILISYYKYVGSDNACTYYLALENKGWESEICFDFSSCTMHLSIWASERPFCFKIPMMTLIKSLEAFSI